MILGLRMSSGRVMSGLLRCLSFAIHGADMRIKCQTLLDETAVLAAMAYIDLNPVRAKICDSLEESAHTSARARLNAIEQDRQQIDQHFAPVLGERGFGVLALKQGDYLELVDHTGRQIHAGKRGAITGPPPAALARIGYTKDQWQRQVLAVGSGYFRAIGAADLLIEKAQEIDQSWLRGIGVARALMRMAT